MCGEVKSKEKDKTASTPLVTVSDLQKLKLGDAIIIRLRTSPFKTKYTPNFKINWGEDFPEAEYPVRQTQAIELFDLKKFVTEAKRKLAMENNNNMMRGLEAGVNPFSFPNSNSMPNGMGGYNPFNSMGQMNPMNNPFSSGPSMSIDDMLKDIDKKLQELDEEERKQKENLKKQNQELMDSVNSSEEKVINELTENNSKEEKKEKPKVNVDVDSVIVNENVITDDEFFDDFFGDE